jgi:hypothetical protein
MHMRHIVCHLWLVRLYNIFPHYLIKCTIFEKVTEYKMCVPISSTYNLCLKLFFILGRNWRGMIKNV